MMPDCAGAGLSIRILLCPQMAGDIAGGSTGPFDARAAPADPANGQPAFGFYARDPDAGNFYPVGLMVLTTHVPGIPVGAAALSARHPW